ncbi:hypothetical protein BJ138DRAFT_1120772 [Hygrophoropsis aurantiaca]|uniref:Uncharacterized protein n=1 Tax=Hygrophoropsis aurantiaca TaxID=72124 RepID=A0ACB7ZPI4_9AGAM|nr:hypothetical protein BJ138DRAFT_1120772 [Hygrophoropsis aurantiaca]
MLTLRPPLQSGASTVQMSKSGHGDTEAQATTPTALANHTPYNRAGAAKPTISTPEDRADYIDFTVPVLDDNDDTSPIPFMWMMADFNQVDETWTLSGTFLSEYILDTFAHHLEITALLDHDSESQKKIPNPRGALALATVAVERAFRCYATGTLVFPDSKALKAFSGSNWSRKTEQVMGSLDHTTARAWKKIIAGATPYIGAHKARLLGKSIQRPTKMVSARSQCYEPDSESNDPMDSSEVDGDGTGEQDSF